MWIWIANKFAKFHAKKLNQSENILKCLRGLLFSETPCISARKLPHSSVTILLIWYQVSALTLSAPLSRCPSWCLSRTNIGSPAGRVALANHCRVKWYRPQSGQVSYTDAAAGASNNRQRSLVIVVLCSWYNTLSWRSKYAVIYMYVLETLNIHQRTKASTALKREPFLFPDIQLCWLGLFDCSEAWCCFAFSANFCVSSQQKC